MGKGAALKGFIKPLLKDLLRTCDDVARKNMKAAAAKLEKQVDKSLTKHHEFTAKPGKRLAKRLDADPSLKKEYERQVKLQEDGLNSMSVDDFVNGSGKRGGKAQQDMRDRFDDMVQERVDRGDLSPEDAQQMKDQLAALHNPDLRGGGADNTDVMSMGDRGVNSSLGANWRNQGGQVDRLRDELQELLDRGEISGDQRMNVSITPHVD